MFGRILLGLALCLNAAGGESGGGGSGATSSGQPAGGAPPPPTPPAIDPEKAKAEARAAVLKDLGFDNEETFAKAKKAKEDEENAKLTEVQKQKKLYDDAIEARGSAEKRADKYKAEADDLRAQIMLRDRLDAAGVLPAERKFVEVALRDAESEAKKAGKTIDDKLFFEELRKARPYFFGTASATPATTSTSRAPAPATTTTTPATSPAPLVNGKSPKDMNDQEFREWAHKQGFI